jgi:hypothetical protein
MANQFCDEHDVTCCNRKFMNHCHFQCKYNPNPIISCYSEDKYVCPDIEQVEKYIAYVAAHEIDSLIDKYVAISHEAHVMKGHSSIILQLCKNEFSDNVYVKERILAPLEGTNILQEEKVCKEGIEMDMFQPELGEELDLPTSSPTYDSKTQTQNSFVIYDNPCYDNFLTKNPCTFCEGNETQMVIYENPSYYEINDASLLASSATSKISDDNENCGLDKPYDNALDDGPMLIDNPPCLEVVTKLCEDKDDILSVCSGNLTHESPTSLLNSPNYTLEEKFSYVKKYLCDLQLSLVPNPCYNQEAMIPPKLGDACIPKVLVTIGKETHHAMLDLGYSVSVFSKDLYELLELQNIEKCSIDLLLAYDMVGSTYTTCNYYERGGDKSPHYATNNYNLQGDVVNIHWKTSIHCYSFIYKRPMHRKEVRLHFYYFCVLFLSTRFKLPNYYDWFGSTMGP